MVDPGATHNFISLGKAAEAGVQIEKSASFGVSLGNGDAIKGEGVCRGVTLQLDGGLQVTEDFLPLKLGSSDVILGVAWLEKLGMVLTDWKAQIMKFEIKGEPVTLVGDPSLVHSQISLKAMRRTLKKQGSGFRVECNSVERTVGEGLTVGKNNETRQARGDTRIRGPCATTVYKSIRKPIRFTSISKSRAFYHIERGQRSNQC